MRVAGVVGQEVTWSGEVLSGALWRGGARRCVSRRGEDAQTGRRTPRVARSCSWWRCPKPRGASGAACIDPTSSTLRSARQTAKSSLCVTRVSPNPPSQDSITPTSTLSLSISRSSTTSSLAKVCRLRPFGSLPPLAVAVSEVHTTPYTKRSSPLFSLYQLSFIFSEHTRYSF